MEEIVKIINSGWVEYEVTRAQADKMLKNGDITYKDIFEIKWDEKKIEKNLKEREEEKLIEIEKNSDIRKTNRNTLNANK